MTYKERASDAFRHPVRQHQRHRDIMSHGHKDRATDYRALLRKMTYKEQH